MSYEIRTIAVMVNKPHEPIFSELATKVEICDEAAGEFLKVSQCNDNSENGTIQITPEEWPVMRLAIDNMIAECREDKS
jgi:hypothetical protein